MDVSARARHEARSRVRELVAAAVGALPDADLLAAYQRTDGEPGNPEADALAEELRRRNIDF